MLGNLVSVVVGLGLLVGAWLTWRYATRFNRWAVPSFWGTRPSLRDQPERWREQFNRGWGAVFLALLGVGLIVDGLAHLL